ncbi:MAG: hypothetical protein IKX41_00730 [Oscillospiraceae bacterium]|nr:hypothetical protein [Oscillospiraceae bacterium]
MKIEYLYPELGNLFGDSANVKYLRACLPEAEIVMTKLGDRPAFADGADLTYCGAMTERGQERALKELRPWREALAESVDAGGRFLMTGNSFELLGEVIEGGAEPLEGLCILPLRAKLDLAHRKNSLILARADGVTLTAFTSRFSCAWPGEGLEPFAELVRGIGINPDARFEGVRKNNFIGSYMLGPVLALNPGWTRVLLRAMGSDAEPAFLEAAEKAYETRLKEFEDTRRKLD